jgi:polysaccharide export outer membrane protein
MISYQSLLRLSYFLGAAVLLVAAGCRTPSIHDQLPHVVQSDLPRELEKMAYPLYRIEPPDILVIEAVHNIRPPGDKLRAGDQLVVRVANTIPSDPQEDPILNEFKIINNVYQVQTDGTIDLGPEYGSVQVVDLTVKEAKAAIDKHLRDVVGLKSPQVAVSLADVSGKQPINGEHLVRMDGTVSLGVYGSVFVSGMTLDEAKAVIEAHLSKSIHKPEVNVDVLAYNSKSFYIVTDGGGYGEQVAKFPCTGNETVLDAVRRSMVCPTSHQKTSGSRGRLRWRNRIADPRG